MATTWTVGAGLSVSATGAVTSAATADPTGDITVAVTAGIPANVAVIALKKVILNIEQRNTVAEPAP